VKLTVLHISQNQAFRFCPELGLGLRVQEYTGEQKKKENPTRVMPP
jgi:hypothetical protein